MHGRVALVTGAGRGLGRELALGLAARGVAVGLLSRTESELADVASTIRSTGGKAVVTPADVGDPEEVRRALDAVRSQLGPIDLLLNNAAVIWPLGPTASLDAERVRQALQINVAAVIALTAAVVPGMVQAGWGQVVNVSSGIAAGPAGMVGATVYAASKAGLEAHTVNLAAELAGTGVSVNVYRPGAVDTPMQAWIRDQSPDEIGPGLHDQFVTMHDRGQLRAPHESAVALLERLPATDSGQIWSFAG